jgi:thioredoxin-dependent peroxiredoxin
MNSRRIIIPFLVVIAIVTIALITFFFLNQEPEQAMLKVDNKIPEFSLPDQTGKVFDIKNVIGQKNLVIYFYPKDDSPGCTKEACSFRDHYEEFVKADAIVIGISSQSVDSHVKFIKKYKLPYMLLSDEDNKVHKMFGVKSSSDGLIPGRVTFVVDKTGTIIYTFNSQSEPVRHVDEALRILKKEETH